MIPIIIAAVLAAALVTVWVLGGAEYQEATKSILQPNARHGLCGHDPGEREQ